MKADEVPAEAETDKPSGEDNSEAVKKRRRRKKKEKESPQTEQIESESETTLDGKNQTPNDKQKKQINSATTHHTHAPVEKVFICL